MNKRKTNRSPSSSKRKTQKRSSLKVGGISNTKKANIVKQFMELLIMIKLYHWKTHSYAQHKATDELYSKLNENIDQFVEVLLGKNSNRVYMLEKHMKMYDLNYKSELREHIFEFRQFFTDMNHVFDPKKDSDLLSIRDVILADLNQFLYLLTFDK